MLATNGLPPTGPGWAFEPKWDGYRGIVTTSGGRVRLTSRQTNNFSDQYPELTEALAELCGERSVVLDGEIVALADDGRPSFRLLQRRNGRPTEMLRKRVPVSYYVFDVLALDGESVCGLPYSRRRELLSGLGLVGSPQVQVSPSYTAADDMDGWKLLNTIRILGLEGIVSKRLDSTYQPNTRSRRWIKTIAAEVPA
jgi:bifunctional non-homologous end joining protein LigD